MIFYVLLFFLCIWNCIIVSWIIYQELCCTHYEHCFLDALHDYIELPNRI